MAQYFRMFRKVAPERAVPLIEVDEDLCAHLNVPVDPHKYYEEWYDCVGFGLACGNSWDRLREIFSYNKHVLEIIDYFEVTYNVDAWSGR